MATQVQWRGGSTAEHSTFTGAAREVTVDTQKQTLVVHDGSTAGGLPLMRENGSNSALSLGSASTPSLKFAGDPNTGIYSPGADQLAVATAGSGRLFIDSGGNVGVGVSPGTRLETYVASGGNTIRITNAANTGSDSCQLQFVQAGAQRAVIYTASNVLYLAGDAATVLSAGPTSPISFNAGGSERLRITSAGLVGVGTSSPGCRLQVDGETRIRNGTKAQSTGYLNLQSTDASNPIRLEFANQTNASWSVQAIEDNTAYRNLLLNPNGGSVGIGTTSPSQLLHLSGGDALIAKTSGYASLYFNKVGINTHRAGAIKKNYDSPFDLRIQGGNNAAAAPICFDRADGSENARFDTSGRLLIGTSSSLGSNAILQAKGTTANSSSYVVQLFDSDPKTVFAVRGDGLYLTGTSSLSPYNYGTAAAANMVVTVDGYLQRSTSSLRHKTSIETIEPVYSEAILGCRPVWYRSTLEADNPDWGYWGFIAEEVEKIDPRLCFYGKDAEGNLRADGVQYDRFVPHLLNLIKCQKEQIEAMEARLSALEAQ